MTFKLIPPTVGRVTSPFGERTHPVTKQKSIHKGIDIAQPGKHDVVAAEKGVVIRTVNDSKYWGYGKTVIVRHTIGKNRFETLYAHLDSVDVVVGQSVKQGQRLGLQGNTGTSTGQHLHFEVHIPDYKPYQPNVVDPMNYIEWEPKKEETTLTQSYEKDAKVGGALKEDFEKAVANGITDGTYPHRPATRAEVAVMIQRATEKLK